MTKAKKVGKARRDKYYWLAKEKGYRARAAFKLIQLNKKYSFLQQSKVLIDLCAAPGSWCQVAAEVMPQGSLIVGVDLVSIKAIPRCITFQGDITTDKCRSTLRQHLKTWKADTVLHDGAPNVGTAWVQDAFSQAELVLQSMKLATEFLIEGGTFVTKIFRSKDYNSLIWVFNQLFTRVEATKPVSSRDVSAEIFVVCRGFKAPKKVDPKFLDPKSVFAELADPTPNNEAKVFNPEKKKRKRDGYEENDWTQFKEAPASEFIQTSDPIAMLGSLNRLSFEQKGNGDIALATLAKLPETTLEILNACADLKVLGRKEFRVLLRWRIRVREIFGFTQKKKTHTKAAAAEAKAQENEVAEVESMDEDLKIQEELQRLQDAESKEKKKERRKENEKKQKDIVRMQLHMQTPMEIGMEQEGPLGEDAMFQLKTVEKHGNVSAIAKGKMHSTSIVEAAVTEPPVSESEDSDPEGDDLEGQLDNLYDDYQERRAAVDAKYRAKKARKEHADEEWEGISTNEEKESEDEDSHGLVEDNDSETSDDDESVDQRNLLKDFDAVAPTENGLSRRAAMFFSQDIFKNIEGLGSIAAGHNADHDSGIDDMGSSEDQTTIVQGKSTTTLIEGNIPLHEIRASISGEDARDEKESDEVDEDVESEHSESDFELVKPGPSEDEEDEWDSDHDGKQKEYPSIDIITAEAMTLAHELATGKKTKADLEDDHFNKYSHRDRDGLPDWFIDDEDRHSKPQKPITKEAAAAIKEKLRALNARPIKKVQEAKARKKFKAAQRLEKLRKRSAVIMEEEGVSERDKASNVAKMMAKAAKRKPKNKTKVVVAKGADRGIKGRPGGARGRYKMVDARLKKDTRAEKRLKKRK